MHLPQYLQSFSQFSISGFLRQFTQRVQSFFLIQFSSRRFVVAKENDVNYLWIIIYKFNKKYNGNFQHQIWNIPDIQPQLVQNSDQSNKTCREHSACSSYFHTLHSPQLQNIDFFIIISCEFWTFSTTGCGKLGEPGLIVKRNRT